MHTAELGHPARHNKVCGCCCVGAKATHEAGGRDEARGWNKLVKTVHIVALHARPRSSTTHNSNQLDELDELDDLKSTPAQS